MDPVISLGQLLAMPLIFCLGITALPQNPKDVTNCSSDYMFELDAPFHLAAVPRDDNTTLIPLKAYDTNLDPPNSTEPTILALLPSTLPDDIDIDAEASLFRFDASTSSLVTDPNSFDDDYDVAPYTSRTSLFSSGGPMVFVRDGFLYETFSDSLGQVVSGPCNAQSGTANYLVVEEVTEDRDLGLYQWTLFGGDTGFSWGCDDILYDDCVPCALKIVPVPGTIPGIH